MRRYLSMGEGALRGVSLDAALYHTRVRGEPVPYSGGRFYLTAGQVTRQGLELALQAEFAAGLSAQLSGTFSRNVYDRYRVDSTFLGVPGTGVVLDGNQVAGLPGRVMNASVTWRPRAAPRLGLEFGAQHLGDHVADDRNLVPVPGFTVVRTAVTGERTLRGGVTARAMLAIENLTDRRFIGSAFINPDYAAGVPLVYEPGLPRQVILGLTLRRAR